MTVHQTSVADSYTWDPPGPGSWSLAADHYPRPITAALAPFNEVWGEVSTAWLFEIGLPIRAARMVTVNGLPYLNFEFEGGSGERQPPAWLLRLLVRVVPSLRRAEARASRYLAARPWVDGTRQWYDHGRAEAIDQLSAITRIDPWTLGDDTLAAHLLEVESSWLDHTRRHHVLHAHDQLPVYLFAARMVEWGFDTETAFGLLAGASPASTGVSPELEELRRAVAGRDATSLDELRALGPEVADTLDRFLLLHGWRLVDGYDLDNRCLIEVPSLVARLASVAAKPSGAGISPEAVRAQVPPTDHAEFDQMLAEARAAYGLRDDNGGIHIAWATGLVRRAMLAAGDRLAARDQLPDPGLVIEATPAEVAAALRHESPLDATELARRAAARRAIRAVDAPPLLGPPEPPPPTDFPGALGVLLRVFALAPSTPPVQPPLHGLGIGDEPYTGPARVVDGHGQGLDAFQPGEVLVATMTSPSYNAVLALAGAVVTEAGDGMSHAAIMARELGLPAVIGAATCTREISDGDLVTVDPVAGRVQVHRGAS
jgi:rifampicin phosphotransferase